MPYKQRVFIPDCFYHIVSRGNRREPLFFTPEDFIAFLQILDHVHLIIPFELASYCFMTNHYHLLLRSEEAPISNVMALINKRYANYYNSVYQSTGHVFEKRFYDKVIEDRAGMIEVCNYIHLNPVKANIVKKPEYYPWSSLELFQNPMSKQPRFMNIHHILDLYAGTMEEKRGLFNQEIKRNMKKMKRSHV